MTHETYSKLQDWLKDGTEAQRRHAIARLAMPDAIEYQSLIQQEKFEYPSLIQQAKNAMQAAGSVAASIVRGEPVLVSQEVQDQRLAICDECELFDHVQRRCTHKDCGCHMNFKTRLASMQCPLKPPKW